MLVTIIMFGFAAASFIPSLYSSNTAEIFIPIWLTLVITAVLTSMWFVRYLMTFEKQRDSEQPRSPTPAHH